MMGQIADDITNGTLCSQCGVFFYDEKENPFEHGFPVLCWSCYDDGDKESRAGIPRSEYEG